jgi:prolipoprotein diacylglyceryl transferase
MMQFLFIKWNIDPEIFRIGGFALRYYSVLFALAFIISYYLLSSIFKKENVSEKLLQRLLVYVIVGTIAGARLGHTLFYEFGYYKNHLLEIILPFRISNGNFELTGYQGLASHGGAIGILVAVALYCKKYHLSFLWVLDRLVIVVALSGFFIRIGNLFNSEIIGKPTDLPWAFIFERVDFIPRHPSQLYEAIAYLIIFFVLWKLYQTRDLQLKKGFLFGLFLLLVFSARFLIEFTKENQEAFEKALPINMGQILSLPFVLAGAYLIFRSGHNGNKMYLKSKERNGGHYNT